MERRRYRRYQLRFEIEVRDLDNKIPLRAATVDISLGGCYVDTLFPLPIGRRIEFVLRVGNEPIRAQGTVHTCHPGVGMGIEFDDLPQVTKDLINHYLCSSIAGPAWAPTR